jgi:Protein of unknown function (DUF2905)
MADRSRRDRLGARSGVYSRSMETAGKLLLAAALVLAALGIGALVLARLGVDRLPGTIHWKPSENVSVTVPVLLMVIVSIVGTIVLNVFFRR